MTYSTYTDIYDKLASGDSLVFNNNQVTGRLYEHKISGGKIEVLIEHILESHRVLANVRAFKASNVGNRIIII